MNSRRLFVILIAVGCWFVLCGVRPANATPPPQVEIFVTSWCPYCRNLERFLISREIRFTKFDVEAEGYARQEYLKLGGGGVPITRINKRTLIRGFDPIVLESALSKQPQRR